MRPTQKDVRKVLYKKAGGGGLHLKQPALNGIGMVIF